MKRVNYICTFLGILISIVFIALYPNEIWSFVYIIAPYIILILLGIADIRKGKKEVPIIVSVMNIWVTIYSLVAIVLRTVLNFDIFYVEWRILVQYVLPLFLGQIINRYKAFESK